MSNIHALLLLLLMVDNSINVLSGHLGHGSGHCTTITGPRTVQNIPNQHKWKDPQLNQAHGWFLGRYIIFIEAFLLI